MTKLRLLGRVVFGHVIARPTGSAVAIHLAGLLRRALRAAPRNDISGRSPCLAPLALAVLVLAGCTAPPSPAPKATPGALAAPAAAATPPPAPSVALPPATLTGYEEKSTMLDNFTVYVAAVDGVPITAGRSGWSTALRIKAGPHRVVLGFSRGVFEARTEMSFTAAGATAYQVKFATDAQLFGQNSYCEFWIEDAATGAAVTKRHRVPLVRNEPGK